MTKIMLSTGEYEIRPVSSALVDMAKAGVLSEFRKSGEPVDPPTYTVKLQGGGEAKENHDETTEKTPEEQILWDEHIKTLEKLRAAQSERTTKVWITQGIVFDMPEDDSWIEKQRWLGVDIPDDLMERRYHYLTTEILVSAEDMIAVTSEIMRLTYKGMMKEDDLQAVINSFRDYVQGFTIKPTPAS